MTNVTHKDVLTAMAELELPTISSEIALKITAKRLEVPMTELTGHNDRVRSRVHERLQKLEEVNAVEKRRFQANDRIHLYHLPTDTETGASGNINIVRSESVAKDRAESL